MTADEAELPSPSAAPSPGSARSPKQASATAFFRRANSLPPAGALASAPIPTCWSASPTNCASSNMRSACRSASATCCRAVLAHSTGRAVFNAALAGGAQALAQLVVGLQAGARADIVTLDTDHPSLAGRRGDAVLDGWIFAAGNAAISCVWASGNRVVEGGRHQLREQARDAFNAAVQRLVA